MDEPYLTSDPHHLYVTHSLAAKVLKFDTARTVRGVLKKARDDTSLPDPAERTDARGRKYVDLLTLGWKFREAMPKTPIGVGDTDDAFRPPYPATAPELAEHFGSCMLIGARSLTSALSGLAACRPVLRGAETSTQFLESTYGSIVLDYVGVGMALFDEIPDALPDLYRATWPDGMPSPTDSSEVMLVPSLRLLARVQSLSEAASSLVQAAADLERELLSSPHAASRALRHLSQLIHRDSRWIDEMVEQTLRSQVDDYWRELMDA